MIKRFFISFTSLYRVAGLFLIFAGCTGKISSHTLEVRDLLGYVDLRLGADPGIGNCTTGVSLPFGFVRPCPHTPDAPTGYHIHKNITGFTVVNAGNVYKYGNLLVSPQTGLDCIDDKGVTNHDSPKANEVLQPEYYAVDLTRFGIKSEMTTERNSAIFRFTYPETREDSASIVIYPSHIILPQASGGKSTFSAINYDPEKGIITGYLVNNDWWYYSRGMKTYFAIRWNKPVTGFGMFSDNGHKITDGVNKIEGDGVGCYLKFNTRKDEQIMLKVTVSQRSVENALKYMELEMPDWNFERVRQNASEKWNKALSSILIDDETITNEEKSLFYTCLYRCFVNPKNKTGDCPWNYDGPFYDDHLAFWDTYRTLFPLLTLLKESVVRDNILSFNEVFRHHGYAYDALIGGVGDMVQGGDNVDVFVAEAFAKEIAGIDWDEAYAMTKGHATMTGRSPLYRENDRGWVPYNSLPLMSRGSVSKTLEFAYNDYCVSYLARGLGYQDDQLRFQKRSGKWTTLWDYTVENEGFKGFIQAKDSAGRFVAIDPNTPSDPFSLFFYEGDSWTYSFYAPHQIPRLIEMIGGEEAFIKRLEYYVANRIEIYNEPCFLTPFLFNYVRRPDLTSFYARKTASSFTLQNYPGEEDSGAMSSWFVFSRLGLFPVAGQDLYLLFGPHYRKVTIQMENGKKIVMNGKNASEDNIYVMSAKLNGKALKEAYLRHADLKNGASITFNMSPDATDWGTKSTPPSPEL